MIFKILLTCLTKSRGHKNVVRMQITNHFCRDEEMKCQLQLTYQTMINMSSLRSETINKLEYETISYFSGAKSKFWEVV